MLFRSASSDFEIKLPETGGVEGIYYIPAGSLTANQWSTVEIPLSSFATAGGDALPADHVVSQVVVKPMSGAQTFYMDDMFFSAATENTAAFLAGPDTPTVAAADVVSLFSDEYTSSLNGVNAPAENWAPQVISEMQIDGGNTIKKFDDAAWAIFNNDAGADLTGMDTLHISLYMTASSEFEIKLPDLGTGGVEGF